MTCTIVPRSGTARPLPVAPIPIPTPKTFVDGYAEVPWDLQLDGRLSATARIILGSLTRWGKRSDFVCWQCDRSLANLHGCSARTIQNALRDGESAGWVRRMTFDELKLWLDGAGMGAMVDRVPLVARSSERLVVLLWKFPDSVPELGFNDNGDDVHLERSCEPPLATFCEVNDSPRRRNLRVSNCVPGALANSCEPSRTCASNLVFNENEKERDNDHSHSGSDPELTTTNRTLARFFAAVKPIDPPAPADRDPAPVSSRSIPQPKPIDPPAPPSPLRLALGQVRRLELERAAAVDALIVICATAFGIPAGDLETLEFWGRSFDRFGESEGGRVALGEILRATFRAAVRDRPHYLSKCFRNEHHAWGAQKTGHRAHSAKSPGDRPVGPRSVTSDRTREVNP